MFDLWQFVPYLLNRAGRRIAEVYSAELDPVGVSLTMWRVMATLHNDGPQRLNDLSRLTTIEQSTLSRLIGQMQEQGLVVRERSGTDARAVSVALTEKGTTVTEGLIPLALRYEAEALKGMSAAEVAELKRLLLLFYDNLEGK